jgi:uncharacterized protein YfcZ (UPF0381/DUF406 family)
METIIIAVVLGIISSIYNQFKKQNGEQRKQAPPKPFTASGPPYPTSREATNQKQMKRPDSEKKIRSQKALSADIKAKKIVDQKKKAEEQIIALTKQKAEIEQKAIEIQNHVESLSNAARNEAKIPLSVEKSNLLNGIIFSEILGPPRSKRPHSFRRR